MTDLKGKKALVNQIDSKNREIFSVDGIKKDEEEASFSNSSSHISFDERMQIVFLILITTCMFTLIFYGYLRTLPNTSLPIGLRKAISFSSDAMTYASSLSVFLSTYYELLQQLSMTISRALPLLPTVTSAPYIWSRKKSRKTGSARSQGWL